MSGNFQDDVILIGDTLAFQHEQFVVGAGPGAKSIVLSNSVGALHFYADPTGVRSIMAPDFNGTVGLINALTFATDYIGGTVAVSTGGLSFNADINSGIFFSISSNTVFGTFTPPPANDVRSLGISTGGNTAGFSGLASGYFVFEGQGNITLSQGIHPEVPFNSTAIVFSVSDSTAPGGIAAGTQTATSGTVLFSNANNITFGMSGSSVITASFSTTPQTPFGISAGTQSVSTGTLVFSNSNGVSFGMSGSSRVTASVDAIKSISAGTTRITNGEAVFSNSNNVSFGANGQTITASASYSQSTAPAAIAAGTQTATTGTILFSNSNGVTFGMSGSSRITASIDGIKSISGGTTRITNGEVVFSNSPTVTFGVNGNTVTASAAGGTAGGSMDYVFVMQLVGV